MTSNRRAEAAYWLLVPILFLAQAVYTIGGLHRMWYEELAEGIRNPFWLDHRLVYDGISSNVGWYGLVLIAYKVFGFSTYTAKYVRLALHVPFLVCSAVLLKRSIGIRAAWLPLLALGLSPTILYFNNLGTSYGTDIQLFPVVLWMIAAMRDPVRAGTPRQTALQFSFGALAMIACLSFPSFLFYLPVLLIVYLRANHRASPAARTITSVSWAAVGFLAPFCAALLYVRSTRAFLSDPAAGGSGVFRGGGHALTLDPREIYQAVSHVVRDLFVGANSYYFTVPNVEFAGALGLAAAAGILLGSVVAAWKWPPFREPLALAGLLCLLSIAAPAFTPSLPGLRRSTGFVSGAYVVVACVWAMPALSAGVNRALVWVAKLACLLLVVHHLAAYLPNYRYLVGVTRSGGDGWFYQFGSPEESVRKWAREWVLEDKPLDCHPYATCRYSEIYPAVAGYLKWNGLGEPPVWVIDPGSTHVIRLTPWYWESHTFGH